MKRVFSILVAVLSFTFWGCTDTPPADDDVGTMDVLFTDPYGEEDILTRTIHGSELEMKFPAFFTREISK